MENTETSKRKDVINTETSNRKDVMTALKKNILFSLYKTDDIFDSENFKYNEKINKVLEPLLKNEGRTLTTSNIRGKAQDITLVSLPGNGTTSLIKKAMMDVASALGLNFVVALRDNYVPNKSDLVWVGYEYRYLDGPVFSIIAPKPTNETEIANKREERLNNIINIFKQSAGGVFEVVDFSPGNTEVLKQDLKKIKEVERVSVCYNTVEVKNQFTNTETKPLFFNSPLTVDSYIRLIKKQYLGNDKNIQVFIDFLQNNKESLFNSNGADYKASPRAWSNLIKQTNLHNFNYRDIDSYACMLLGNEVGKKFSAYYLEHKKSENNPNESLVKEGLDLTKLRKSTVDIVSSNDSLKNKA